MYKRLLRTDQNVVSHFSAEVHKFIVTKENRSCIDDIYNNQVHLFKSCHKHFIGPNKGCQNILTRVGLICSEEAFIQL